MKVRALRTGYYPDINDRGEQNWMRRRGDDVKGEGMGDVFELKPRGITIVDKEGRKPVLENGKVQMRLLTVDEQFSERWMERVSDDTPERTTTAQEALTMANAEISAARRPGRKP